MNIFERLFGKSENKQLRSELRAANERIADLAGQSDWKSKAKILTEDEERSITELRASFDAMNAEQNEIAKYLRRYYADEIARGEHAGMSLVEILKRYLSRERQATAKAGGAQ